MISCRAFLLLPLALCSLAGASQRIPVFNVTAPWADPRLKVLSGLELWLDAGRINAARQAQGQPPFKSDALLDLWPDSSEHGRHVVQAAKNARPRLLQVEDGWIVRFDGVDDYLRRTTANLSLQACTVFAVAAPHDNPGDFRGFLAVNEAGRRDYESGFTIDMSFVPGSQFEQVNVEGRGFGGAVNLLTGSRPFGELHVLEAVLDPEKKDVQLFLDGQRTGQRPLNPSTMRADEITIGARYYTNGPGAQQVRGHLPGDLAEVLIYNRVLSAEETKAVRQYLEQKYAKVKAALPSTLKIAGGQPLERVTNPPPVQMFVPGFRVSRLPLDLTNINNVRYRADGKLVALAYNGNIYLLSDTDGDGLEDKAELFWENKGSIQGPIGMALTPPGYKHGNGVFVACKGKLVLIVDTDGDGKADKEIVVAQGWKELPHGVDALGVALDPSGNIYFGIGTADFTNAYLLDKEGHGRYDLKNERGTIQRVSADFSRRETVCTGIRFPVAIAFNRLGDLFCTDQEGATWLSNGNPFDELLHIQPGRHYGFPPRHPRHLPSVIDEPSVFDYGPQHQSTCGLVFNESVNGGPIFGPSGWESDALVCGESRGKLFRTKLAKTPSGYVAQNQLFACLQQLTIDACVSPAGELVVTTHSGPPDWGTGPGGKGTLYKISYAEKSKPQPVAVWAAGPQEVRVAFDRPLDLQQLKQLVSQAKITFGEYVSAGDRFESLKPPYQALHMQQRKPRYDLPIYSAQVAGDQRTLILATAPQRQAVSYALMLPAFQAPELAKKSEVTQHPQMDLAYSLNGVAVSFEPKSGPKWTGWLPHLDLAVAQSFTKGSTSHEALSEQLKTPGTLTLQTKLNLHDMLRPAVQPGSRLDYEWPTETVTVTFTASTTFGLQFGSDASKLQSATRLENGTYVAALAVTPKAQEPVPIKLQLATTGGAPVLNVAYHTNEDVRPRAMPCHRFFLPWAELGPKKQEIVQRDIPELAGGSWARGRKVFFSEEAGCAKCHTIGGQGGAIGPNLSNLVHRDYESVMRDVAEPSFAINPDFVSYVVSLKNGRLLTGTLRTEGDNLLIGDEKGQTTTVKRSEIDETHAATKSIMPEGLPKLLGPERMKDLMTFLLTEPIRMPADAKLPPPSPRTRAEVNAILAGAPAPAAKTRPLHLVLIAGPKDHGPGEHDYPAWHKAWAELLAAADNVTIAKAWEWPSAEEFQRADVMIFYQHGSWTPARAKDIDAFLARGGGLVYIHWAVDGSPNAPGFAQRIGLTAAGGMIAFRHGPLDLGFETGSKHPIGRNFTKLHLHDESYWKLTGDPKKIQLLASGIEEGEPRPLFWTIEPSKGRVFVSIPGHYSWTFDDPLFRILLLRGIAWTGREPVDRFNSLVTLGASLAD